MEHHLDLFSDITVPKKLNSIRKSNSLVRIHKLVDMSVFPHLVNKVNPPKKTPEFMQIKDMLIKRIEMFSIKNN